MDDGPIFNQISLSSSSFFWKFFKAPLPFKSTFYSRNIFKQNIFNTCPSKTLAFYKIFFLTGSLPLSFNWAFFIFLPAFQKLNSFRKWGTPMPNHGGVARSRQNINLAQTSLVSKFLCPPVFQFWLFVGLYRKVEMTLFLEEGDAPFIFSQYW